MKLLVSPGRRPVLPLRWCTLWTCHPATAKGRDLRGTSEPWMGRWPQAGPASSARIRCWMAEFQMADASLRRFNAAVTIIVCAAVVGLAY